MNNSGRINQHHEFSPSKLDRMDSCPWSYKNCIGWNPGISDDACRGTILHESIYDDAVFEKLNNAERENISRIREEHIFPYREMERYHELLVQIVLDGKILTEGTLDDLTISPDGKTANLKDWKFGSYEVVPATENLQIKAYVCGIFHKFPKIQTVFALIVQPVFGFADYEKQAVFHRSEYKKLLSEISSVIANAKDAEEKDSNPTADNCRYCNKHSCRAFREKMNENFRVMAVNNDIIEPKEKEMTVDYADRLLCASKEITHAMLSKTELAKKVIIKNGGSANFRVQNGRATKTTNWQAIARKYNIQQEDIDSETVISTGEPFLMPKMRRNTKIKQLN